MNHNTCLKTSLMLMLVCLVATVRLQGQCASWMAGTYTAAEYCSVSGSSTFEITIVASASSDTIEIYNLYDLASIPVMAIVICDSQQIIIPLQGFVFFTLEGYGSFNVDSLIHISMTFVAINDYGVPDYCGNTWVSNFPFVGIETINNYSFECFPNPTTSHLHFTPPSTETIQQIIITTSDGRVAEVMDASSIQDEKEINVSHLTPGLYLVRIETVTSVFLSRFIKL